MKRILKHKNKIIVGALIIAVLIFVFFWGGNSHKTEEQIPSEAVSEQAQILTSTPQKEKKEIPKQETITETEQQNTQAIEPQETDSKNTEPLLQDNPTPSNTEDVQVADNALTCTLSIRCDTILQNIDKLDSEKTGLVPKDGIILGEQEVIFYEGESVFNVLLRETKKNKIHFEFVNTPIYNSAYIEGIANLYEFDCGELSGWVYKVNDWFPNYGCSRYMLKQGDKIEWLYTCDLGRDVGSYGGLQRDE